MKAWKSDRVKKLTSNELKFAFLAYFSDDAKYQRARKKILELALLKITLGDSDYVCCALRESSIKLSYPKYGLRLLTEFENLFMPKSAKSGEPWAVDRNNRVNALKAMLDDNEPLIKTVSEIIDFDYRMMYLPKTKEPTIEMRY